MKDIKKLTALALAVILVIFTFVSCTKPDKTGDGEGRLPNDFENSAEAYLRQHAYRTETSVSVSGLVIDEENKADISEMSIVTVVSGENLSSVCEIPALEFTRTYTVYGTAFYYSLSAGSGEDRISDKLRASISDEELTAILVNINIGAYLSTTNFGTVSVENDVVSASGLGSEGLDDLTSSIFSDYPGDSSLRVTAAEMVITFDLDNTSYSTKTLTLTLESTDGQKSFSVVITTKYSYDESLKVSAPSDWQTYEFADFDAIFG